MAEREENGMLQEWVLMLTIFWHSNPQFYAAVESLPMATEEACKAAGEKWEGELDKSRGVSWVCVKTGS